MQIHKTKNIFVSLLLLAVGVVYAQNPSAQIYIADGATFFVSENTTAHIHNGWTEIGNAKTSVVETVINSNTQKQTPKNSLKRLKKALESNKTPLVKQEDPKDKNLNTIKQVLAFPFGSFPIGTTNAILTRLAIVPSTTASQNHKKTSLKKSQNTSSFLSPTALYNIYFELEKNSSKTKPNFTETLLFRNSKFIIQIIARPPPPLQRA